MARFAIGDRVRLRGGSELGLGIVAKVDHDWAFVCWEDAASTTVIAGDYGRIEVVEVAHYAPPDVPVLAVTPSVEAKLREAIGDDRAVLVAMSVLQSEAGAQRPGP